MYTIKTLTTGQAWFLNPIEKPTQDTNDRIQFAIGHLDEAVRLCTRINQTKKLRKLGYWITVRID